MTDATNRKLDVENTDEDRISRDDPLFELSQIIGYSERDDASEAEFPSEEGQMDLEDALMRELGDFSDAEAEAAEGLSGAVEEYDSAIEAEPAAGPVEEIAEFKPEASESMDVYEPQFDAAPEPAEEGAPDTLEAELMDLLGGLGDKAGTEWTHEAPAAYRPVTPAEHEAPAADVEETPAAPEEDYSAGPEEAYYEPEADYAAPEAEEEVSPQVPAAAPVWYDLEDRQDDAPVAGSDDDSEILDAFESALSENLALSFEDETRTAAQVAPGEEGLPDEAEQELDFKLDFEEAPEEETGFETEARYSADELEGAYLTEIEAAADEISAETAENAPPVLETADLSASDMEAMQPLDLPELPEVEEAGPTAVDIERELDAALSGYDNYAAVPENEEPEMRAAATAAAAADTRLDFDMGAFEDDLARDLEFVGHDMEAEGDEADYDGDEAREGVVVADARRPKRGMMIAAAVGGIAILGAIGAFGLTSRDGGDAGEPVLVQADSEPVKVVPDDPGGKEVPNQDRAVYGEVDGNGETAPTQETLVSTSEEPVDLGGTGETVLPNGMTETAKVEDRLTPDMAEAAAPAAAESGSAVLAPRRVRTVIVKPDGTLVENAPEPEATAPATPEPAETAEAPAETGEPISRIDMAASAPQASEAPSGPATEAAGTASSTGEEAATAEQLAAIAEPEVAETPETAEEAGSETATRQPLRAPSAIPERPADQPVTIVGSEQPAPRQQTTQQVAEAAPQQQTPAASSTVSQQAVPAGSYTVQIASQPSAELAQQTAADLSRVYADVIGNRQVAIQQAEIEGRGTYHRVRIVANGRQDAVSVCERIKQQGGSCFVAR